MIYELVEAIKEVLTDNNSPCGQCALCLFDFTVGLMVGVVKNSSLLGNIGP